jgi:hypothetical protein
LGQDGENAEEGLSHRRGGLDRFGGRHKANAKLMQLLEDGVEIGHRPAEPRHRVATDQRDVATVRALQHAGEPGALGVLARVVEILEDLDGHVLEWRERSASVDLRLRAHLPPVVTGVVLTDADVDDGNGL